MQALIDVNLSPRLLLPPHQILYLLTHRQGPAPVVREHGQRIARVEVHQEVGADAGEAAAVAHGAADWGFEDPEAVAVCRRVLLRVRAPQLIEHPLRDEFPRAERDVEGEEVLDGGVAAPPGAAAQHVLEDVVAVARAVRPLLPLVADGEILVHEVELVAVGVLHPRRARHVAADVVEVILAARLLDDRAEKQKSRVAV